jgi:hypothetical protein
MGGRTNCNRWQGLPTKPVCDCLMQLQDIFGHLAEDEEVIREVEQALAVLTEKGLAAAVSRALTDGGTLQRMPPR